MAPAATFHDPDHLEDLRVQLRCEKAQVDAIGDSQRPSDIARKAELEKRAEATQHAIALAKAPSDRVNSLKQAVEKWTAKLNKAEAAKAEALEAMQAATIAHTQAEGDILHARQQLANVSALRDQAIEAAKRQETAAVVARGAARLQELEAMLPHVPASVATLIVATMGQVRDYISAAASNHRDAMSASALAALPTVAAKSSPSTPSNVASTTLPTAITKPSPLKPGGGTPAATHASPVWSAAAAQSNGIPSSASLFSSPGVVPSSAAAHMPAESHGANPAMPFTSVMASSFNQSQHDLARSLAAGSPAAASSNNGTPSGLHGAGYPWLPEPTGIFATTQQKAAGAAPFTFAQSSSKASQAASQPVQQPRRGAMR